MASFTDKVPTFNPYVQQQPVEAMVKVGMHKQQQYDQGLQRIQESFNNIAGLDILRDQDKSYLKSKLGETTSKLKSYAAGDFSSAQLVNSVTGVVNNLSNDNIIRNSVIATQFYRKEAARLEKDINEGKENPANTLDFNLKTSKWLNSEKAGETFNGRYVTPTDVWKKITNIAKEVGVDAQTIEEMYQRDENGQYIRDKNGNPKWNEIMVEKTLKGKDAGKILRAFEAGLTPQDYEQLNIEGRYFKSGQTTEMLKEEIGVKYDAQIDTIDKKLALYNASLTNEQQKGKDKDEQTVSSLTSLIEFFTNKKNQLLSSKDKNFELVDSNPDAVRGNLYTNNYLFTMANALSSQEVSTKHSVSPKFTVNMELNKFAETQNENRRKAAQWQITHNEGVRQFNLKMKYEHGVDEDGNPIPGLGSLGDNLDMPLPTPDGAEFALAAEKELETNVSKINDLNMQMTVAYFKNAKPKMINEKEHEYEQRIKTEIANLAKLQKKSINSGSGEVNEFTTMFANAQISKWQKDPKSLKPEFRSLAATASKLLRDTNLQKEEIQRVKQEALSIAATRGITVPSDEEIKKNIKSTTITIDGSPLILSQQDVVDLAHSRPEKYNTFGNLTVDKNQISLKQRAVERLTLKYGEDLMRKIRTNVYGVEEIVDENGKKKQYLGRVNKEVEKAGEFINSSAYNELSKIESEIYIEKGTINRPYSNAVLKGKLSIEDFNTRVSQVVNNYKKDLNEAEGFNSNDIQAAILNTDKKAIMVETYPGNFGGETKYLLKIHNPNDTKREFSAYINQQEFSYLTGKQAGISKQVPAIINLLNSKKTTNSFVTENPDTAYWPAESFSNYKDPEYTITGDLVNDSTNENQAWLYLYKINKKTGEFDVLHYPHPIEKYIDGVPNFKLEELPSLMTTALIKQIESK